MKFTVSKHGPPFVAWRHDRNGITNEYPTPELAARALHGRGGRPHSKLERRIMRKRFVAGLRIRARFRYAYRSRSTSTGAQDMREFMRAIAG